MSQSAASVTTEKRVEVGLGFLWIGIFYIVLVGTVEAEVSLARMGVPIVRDVIP